MPVSNYMPDVVVEIAFTSGYTTPAASRTWTDVSAYVEAQSAISITRGRGDQFATPQPSRLTLTLDNRDGRFTPENTSGAYYPNVKKGRPIRVRVKPVGAGAYVDRYLGYIDEWPVAWPDGTTVMSTVTVTAMSRQARYGRGATLRSIVEEEYLYDLPVLYFPLGEPQGSTTAGNVASGRSEVLAMTQVGTGGTLTFGQGTGPGTDDLTAPVLAPVSSGNGVRLDGALVGPVVQSGAAEVDVEVFLSTTVTGQAVLGLTFGQRSDGTYKGLRVEVDSLGRVKVTGRNESGTVTVTSTATVADGATHHVSARLSLAGGNLTPSVMVDGGTRVTGTTGSGESPAEFRTISLGGGGLMGTSVSSDLFTGTLAHLAIFVSTPGLTDGAVTRHAQAGLSGFVGESSGARIQRYARLAGIPAAEISTEAGLSTSIAHKDTTGELPAALMQDVAQTEDGVVFDGKDGTLTFHARSHRYGATSAFTLSVTAGDVEGDLVPKLDDQNLTNDMTASRPGGVTVRSTNDASIAEYGYYRESVEVLTTSDNEVQSRADWQVNRFGTPRVTVPNLGVDLISCSSSLITALLAADIGTKFTVTGLPSQAPASTMDFFIEGYAERIGAESYTIELNTSAAAYANVWQLESATLGQLDSTTVLAY